MAKPHKFRLFIGILAVFLTACLSTSLGDGIAPGDPDGDLRRALDARIELAGDRALFIGEDRFRFELSDQEHRVAQAVVQIVPYDVDQRRSHGKGVGAVFIAEGGQQFLLTAAHILYHPRTRQKRAQDVMLFSADPNAPPHILSSDGLPDRFSSLMPFLTHMDDILLIPIEPMSRVDPLPLTTLNVLNLDARPITPTGSALSAVSCDFLSEDYPTACFAQSFSTLAAERINLYSAVTSDMDVYPGLSGSPVLTVFENEISVLGVIISGSRQSNCPTYALPDCYALVGPMTQEAQDQALQMDPLSVREEFRDLSPSERRDIRSGWWRDY